MGACFCICSARLQSSKRADSGGVVWLVRELLELLEKPGGASVCYLMEICIGLHLLGDLVGMSSGF